MKILLISLFCSLLFTNVEAQQQNYRLSTHILDISKGVPAANVTIRLEKQIGKAWQYADEKQTDQNGRISDFLPVGVADEAGIYKLTFFVKPYFEQQNLPTFYPFIEVVFEIKADGHYHVPITLSQFGYSTYRGN